MLIKKIILPLLLISSPAAIASELIYSLLTNERPNSLAALECPNKPYLTLKLLSDWRAEGAAIEEFSGDFQTQWAALKARGEKISSIAAHHLFFTYGGFDLERVDLATDGEIDPRSIGMPRIISNCKVIPVMMEASQLRAGPSYIVVKKAFDRLSPLDQFVFKQIVSGFKLNVIRALLDANSLAGSLSERFERLNALGMPYMNTGEVEIDVSTKRSKFSAGRLVSADGYSRFSRNNSDSLVATFYENGKVREIRSKSGVYFPLLKDGNSQIDFTRVSGCQAASFGSSVGYREDGTMLFCGQRMLDRNGVSLGAGKSRIDSGTKKDFSSFDSQPAEIQREFLDSFLVVESEGVGRSLELINIPAVEKLSLSVGEPACGAFSYSVSASVADSSRNDVTIQLPANCVGIVQTTWKKSSPGIPKSKGKG